jgi:hypothetical protein
MTFLPLVLGIGNFKWAGVLFFGWGPNFFHFLSSSSHKVWPQTWDWLDPSTFIKIQPAYISAPLAHWSIFCIGGVRGGIHCGVEVIHYFRSHLTPS